MIGYPNNKNVNTTKSLNHVLNYNQKGMSFEERINKANTYYLDNDIAHIYKKPTPIKVLKTKQYNQNFQRRVEIQKATFEKKSTTDYNGVYKGFYIDFEAKETKYKSFNIKSNLHHHQRKHLEGISKHGGVGFIIVNFIAYDRAFLLNINEIKNYEQSLLKIEFFEENAIEIKQNKTIYLDYIKALDKLLKKEYNG